MKKIIKKKTDFSEMKIKIVLRSFGHNINGNHLMMNHRFKVENNKKKTN